MADIELVIKISEGLKNDFESEQWTALSCMEMKNALEKATPLPKKHGDIIDRGFMVAKLLDEILFGRVKTPMDCIDFIKNYKITVPATEGFTPYFCQNRLPDKEDTE